MSSRLHPARLVEREDAGGDLVLLTLEPSTKVRESYVRPGQYVSVRAGSATSHFVLAGPIAASHWQLLVRRGGTVANAAIAMPLAGTLETTPAMGAGFPVADARARTLILAATGSGIAAMRPVIVDRITSHDATRTWLYLGIRTRSELPLVSELTTWRESGVHVTVCLSRDVVGISDDGFAPGYVQDVAGRSPAEGATGADGGMIFAAGINEMITAMRALAHSLGIAESDVRTNY